MPTEITSLIPERYRFWLVLGLALSPYVTRAYRALADGRGIKGMLSAIWLGTNTPRADSTKPTDKAP